jgi:hypothetical protein
MQRHIRQHGSIMWVSDKGSRGGGGRNEGASTPHTPLQAGAGRACFNSPWLIKKLVLVHQCPAAPFLSPMAPVSACCAAPAACTCLLVFACSTACQGLWHS